MHFDFIYPRRFGLEYVGEDGERHQPLMVHRALWGSVQRFFGVLIEHYAERSPLGSLPCRRKYSAERNFVHIRGKLTWKLKEAGFRALFDYRNEKFQPKIRDAQLQKIPYMLNIGGKRSRGGNRFSAPPEQGRSRSAPACAIHRRPKGRSRFAGDAMTSPNLRYEDIFVPGGFPKHTYNPRGELGLEQRLRESKNNLCKLVTITGQTKSGKTVLARKIFPPEEAVWIDGGTISEEEELLAKHCRPTRSIPIVREDNVE